ncbi:MAG: acyltransferase [Crocinitomicaceae bacterium]|nr:acyltransferase [Crocinitomicaceae bacterium]
MIWFYLKNLRLLRVSGIFVPFKIANPAIIQIQQKAILKLGSRITIGNKKKALLSGIPTNLNFRNNSSTFFGRSVSIGPGVNIIAKEDAELHIGDNTYFTSDAHIEAVKSIRIGKDCAISWGVTIIDSNHHDIIYGGKKAVIDEPVIIGDNVWIGCNVTILKGTLIGSGSIVAAGSIVSGTYPENSLIAGNPAKLVRENVDWK